MDTKEIRELPREEVLSEIKKMRDKVFRLRFHGKGKDLENPGEYKGLRRSVARMFTILRERELKSEAASAKGSTSPKRSKSSKDAAAGRKAGGSA